MQTPINRLGDGSSNDVMFNIDRDVCKSVDNVGIAIHLNSEVGNGNEDGSNIVSFNDDNSYGGDSEGGINDVTIVALSVKMPPW